MDLLSLNSGYSLIDFGKTKKKVYIQACIEGMHQDYSKMRVIISEGLKRSDGNL